VSLSAVISIGSSGLELNPPTDRLVCETVGRARQQDEKRIVIVSIKWRTGYLDQFGFG
jgi:hypothetical protein